MLQEILKDKITIGIDIDDTITNSYNKIIDYTCNYYNYDKDYVLNNKLTYDFFVNNESFPNYEEFVFNNYEKILYDVELKDNAKEAVDFLHNNGYKIVFITARSDKEYKDPYKYTIDYLKRNNIYYDEVYTNILDKGIFCREHNISLFIDDSINNCTKVNNEGIYTLLFTNIYNEHCNSFDRLNNYGELIDIIKTL